jgi:broad specificity phosphatase PhoE
LTLGERWFLSTIRHGETDFNKQGRYAGSIDIPLNEAGRLDAMKASANLKEVGFEVCLSSPYARAMETARLLTAGKVAIVPNDDARERHFGILQGKTSKDVETVRPPIHFIKVGGDYHSMDIPEGESLEEVRQRAQRLMDYICENHARGRVLVVSHGVLLQQLHGVVKDQDWITSLGTYVGNLELTTFAMEGERAVSEVRCHLMTREQCNF